MLTSIIIPTFKRADLLRLGLSSLARQVGIKDKVEVLVLNDGPQDDTEKVCKDFLKQINIRYIFTGERNLKEEIWRIPTMPINIGLRQAEGEFCIISCPEIFLLQNDIIHLYKERFKLDNKLLIKTKGWDDRKGDFLNLVLNHGDYLSFDFSAFYKLSTEYPFFLGFSRDIAVDIGGYNEDYVEGYCFDDNDFVDRMCNYGCTYFQIDRTIVHLFHPRLRYGLSEVRCLWERNRLIYLKNKGIIYANCGRKWGEL